MAVFGLKRVEEKAMDKVNETRRALFEAWALTNSYLEIGREELKRDSGDGYEEIETHIAWQAFNAALDAVQIELPRLTGMDQPFTGTPISEIRAHNHYNRAVMQCRAAIESTSLGLRIK
jgi:hypothetical protein